MIVGEGLCSNIYVIGGDSSVLVDAGVGNRMNPIWPQLASIGIDPPNINKVILTHAHHDHAMGVFLVLERTNARIYIHEDDSKFIASNFGDSLKKVREGDIIETDFYPLEVIHTPGHTEGGICLYAREQKILFSGDTVFADAYFGRFDGESGDLEKLLGSLKKLSKLKVDIILSGHGDPVLHDAEENIKKALWNAQLYN